MQRTLWRWLERIGAVKPPTYLLVDVCEMLTDDEVKPGCIYRERREGYDKWAYLRCPRCHECIRLPLGRNGRWSLQGDWMARPTIAPSIWQTGSCQAHFFVRRGDILWCAED